MSDSTLPVEARWVFPRLWAAFVLVLVAVTWPLWFTDGNSAYPMVSLLGPNLPIPSLIGSITSTVLILSLLALVADPLRFRFAWWLVFVALALGFVVDQHRLQPWAYQTAVYAIVFGLLDRQRAQPFLILVAASVYLFSALGKFDFQFLHTVGQDFLRVVAGPVGGLPNDWDVGQRAKLVAILPGTELIIGIGLLIPPFRRFVAVAVMGMHASLLWILGPWGLNHSTGVLVWNGLLLIQGYVLFFRSAPAATSSELTRSSRSARWIVAVVVACVVTFPLLERPGYWDHWLSWSLYSPHTSRLELEIHRSVVDELSDDAASHLQPDSDGDGWQRLSLEEWSLRARRVPVYPQARYQLGLSVALAERHGWKDQVRARWRSVSDRWSGQREEKRLLGISELRKQGEAYWLWME